MFPGSSALDSVALPTHKLPSDSSVSVSLRHCGVERASRKRPRIDTCSLITTCHRLSPASPQHRRIPWHRPTPLTAPLSGRTTSPPGRHRRLSRYLSICLRCFFSNSSLLDALIFWIQPHLAGRFPVSCPSTPSLRVSLLCCLIERIAFNQNRSLRTVVALCWRHKLVSGHSAPLLPLA